MNQMKRQRKRKKSLLSLFRIYLAEHHLQNPIRYYKKERSTNIERTNIKETAIQDKTYIRKMTTNSTDDVENEAHHRIVRNSGIRNIPSLCYSALPVQSLFSSFDAS